MELATLKHRHRGNRMWEFDRIVKNMMIYFLATKYREIPFTVWIKLFFFCSEDISGIRPTLCSLYPKQVADPSSDHNHHQISWQCRWIVSREA